MAKYFHFPDQGVDIGSQKEVVSTDTQSENIKRKIALYEFFVNVNCCLSLRNYLIPNHYEGDSWQKLTAGESKVDPNRSPATTKVIAAPPAAADSSSATRR